MQTPNERPRGLGRRNSGDHPMTDSNEFAHGSAGPNGPSVRLTFDGTELHAVAGQTIAAALLAAGRRVWRYTGRRQEPRGMFCGMGICFDCLVRVDGRPNVRACQALVAEGMRIETRAGHRRVGGFEVKRPLVIVGAGPAGLAAAIAAAEAGVEPLVIDENPRVGGQIYRQPPAALEHPAAASPAARRGVELLRKFESLRDASPFGRRRASGASFRRGRWPSMVRAAKRRSRRSS